MKKTLGVLLLIASTHVVANAQTIADLARQERAKRQSSPNAIVFSNRSIKTGSAASNPASQAKAESPAPPPAPETDGRDEKWWRSHFEQVRADIQRLEGLIPVLEADVTVANREFLTRSYDPDGRGQRAIADAKAKVEAAKADLAQAKERRAQLDEELRRSGSPAGWAR